MTTEHDRPAILGGPVAFPDGVPYTRPLLPPLDQVVARLEASYGRGVLTNGELVRELEARMADRLGVAHAVAVASCTSGLMLALRALRPEGKALMPSFTFSATAHAAAWNGLTPLFVDCVADSYQLDCDAIADQVDGVGVIVGTHVLGAPCPAERIEAIAAAAGIPLLFDAASALGASRQGCPVGSFGDVEVFSLSPTKPLTAGEGGLVTTSRPDVAEAVRTGRDYGNPGDYDTRFVGLNARMSELHAALALESLELLDGHLARRRELAEEYQKAVSDLPGIVFQAVDEGDVATYKDVALTIDPDAFGLGRDDVARALRADGIQTRTYFFPPVHRQTSYVHLDPVDLPITDAVAARVLNLPLFAALEADAIPRIAEVIAQVHDHAKAIAEQAPPRS